MAKTSTMDIQTFTVGPFQENTYLLTRENQALLIDPGFYSEDEYREFKSTLSESGADLIAICLTHAHVDHVLGLNRVLSDFNVPVYINQTDMYLWNNFSQQASMFGFKAEPIQAEPKPLAAKPATEIGSFTFDVLYTPGHSPDHVSLYFKTNALVVSGDVLFKESIGRTDLYKGNIETLSESVKNELYKLPGNTKVYPGHGPSTTIAHEKKNNPFVKG
jgi:glyoxylase-like metal-dependent hydrolase (beta-lactamase superfamily II)